MAQVLFLCDKILEIVGSSAWLGELSERLEGVISRIKATFKVDDGNIPPSLAVFKLQVIDSLYKIEDALEQANTGNNVTNKACLFFSPSSHLVARGRLVSKIEELTKLIEGMADDAPKFTGKVTTSPLVRRRPATCSYVYGNDIIGRDEDIKVVVNMLLDSKDKVDVISIVGEPGVGKTALAQLVFNDRRIIDQFDLRIWVCASNTSSLTDIIGKTIQSVTCCYVDSSVALEQLCSSLQTTLLGKLFLLVVDDVEEVSCNWWLDFHRLLIEAAARGSKILVTTRSDNTVQMMSDTQPYKVKGLSERDSWALFEVVAFGPERQDPELIGIRIYDELSLNLKSCLAYCSLFPVEYELNKLDLISLWMAQGFIKPQEGQSFWDTGEDYYMQFLRSGFFQEVKKGELGDSSICNKNFACDVVGDAYGSSFLKALETQTQRIDCRIRHVSVSYIKDSMCKEYPSFFEAQELRTLLWMEVPNVYLSKSMCNKLVSDLTLLRVLDLHSFGIKELPGSIGKLTLLRYLDLSENDSLEELPESITRLYHLQTLKLNHCEKLKGLPKGIGRLINLIRLEIDECDSLIGIPPGLERVTGLQILSRFMVGKDGSDPKRNGGLKVLKGLQNLRGRLTIELFENWTTAIEEAEVANLSTKHKLSELRIDWRVKRLQQQDPNLYQKLLEGFQPHQNLKLLSIEGYGGGDFPNWAGTDMLALPNLVVLSIADSSKCQHLLSFCQLPKLKRLTLRFMDGVHFMETGGAPPSTIFFPSLEELTVHSFNNLKGWTQQGLEVEQQLSFPRLRKLKMWNCPKVMHMPLFPNVEDLNLLNVNQKLLQDSRGSPAATDPSSSTTNCSSFTNIFRNIPRLRRLQIKEFPNMKSFPALAVPKSSSSLSVGSCLEYLVIDRCGELSSLAEGLQHHSKLEELEISSCNELDLSLDGVIPWESLANLRYLTFHDIPKMKKLPDGLKHVSTIKVLCVSSCNSLASLPNWMSSLSSLSRLRLEGCPLLTRLPDSLKDLHSLVKVEITECPELVEKCREHTGEERHKIEHAVVLLHKSWRYGLLSDLGQPQPRQQSRKMGTEGPWCCSRQCHCPVKTCNCSCHCCCHCQKFCCRKQTGWKRALSF